jgi:hypothetical protein
LFDTAAAVAHMRRTSNTASTALFKAACYSSMLVSTGSRTRRRCMTVSYSSASEYC